LDVWSNFEKMEVSGDSLGSLKSRKVLQTLLGLVAQLLTNLGRA
jgi:hypothetical protein